MIRADRISAGPRHENREVTSTMIEDQAGGQIVWPVDPAAGEVFAWFSDPGGNVLGIYQQPGLAQMEAGADEEIPHV
jgi:hypothetical protein